MLSGMRVNGYLIKKNILKKLFVKFTRNVRNSVILRKKNGIFSVNCTNKIQCFSELLVAKLRNN